MIQLAEFSAGRYTLSSSHFRDCRLACLKLVGQQAAAGLSLAAATGVVRGWLRPRARERSAALCRCALVRYIVCDRRVSVTNTFSQVQYWGTSQLLAESHAWSAPPCASFPVYVILRCKAVVYEFHARKLDPAPLPPARVLGDSSAVGLEVFCVSKTFSITCAGWKIIFRGLSIRVGRPLDGCRCRRCI